MPEVIEPLTREQFDKDWSWGAEPIATIPGEPMYFYKADKYLENWKVAVFDTEEGKYYIRRADGTYLYNPKSKSALFDTVEGAQTEYFNSLKEVPKPPAVGEVVGIPYEFAGKLKTITEMFTTPEIGRLYPELEELMEKRGTAIDRMGDIQEKGGSGARYSAIRDKAEADLVSLQIRIARERPDLGLWEQLKPLAVEYPKMKGGNPMTEQPEKKCDIDDMLCQLKVMNHLEGMKNLLGSEGFKSKFPEFEGLEETVSGRMREQKTTIREAFDRCGLLAPDETGAGGEE